MGVWFVPLTLVLGWLFAILNWATPWGATDPTFSENALAWLFFLPGGIMFITSGFMHTVLAKSTAKNIGSKKKSVLPLGELVLPDSWLREWERMPGSCCRL